MSEYRFNIGKVPCRIHLWTSLMGDPKKEYFTGDFYPGLDWNRIPISLRAGLASDVWDAENHRAKQSQFTLMVENMIECLRRRART